MAIHEHAALTSSHAVTLLHEQEESKRASERLGWPLVERDERGVWHPWFRSDAERRRYQEQRGIAPGASRTAPPGSTDWAADAAARARRLDRHAADLEAFDRRHPGLTPRPARRELTAEERHHKLVLIKAEDLYGQFREAGASPKDAAALALVTSECFRPEEPDETRARRHTLGRVALL